MTQRLFCHQNFVFKVKGRTTHLVPPEAGNYRWATKGSYRIKKILGMIKKIPNQFNMFPKKGFTIYVLDDYGVHLMPKFDKPYLKKDRSLLSLVKELLMIFKINDTIFHRLLKSQYRDLEMKLMLEQLEENPTKIPSLSRNEMMSMLLASCKKLQIDSDKELKPLFVSNALDGSGDYLISDKLYTLIEEEMMKFQKYLMLSKSIKALKEVVRKLMPPKGINRKENVEGSELLHCENEQIPIEEFQEECNNEEETNEDVEPEENNENRASVVIPTANDNLTSNVRTGLSLFTNEPDIKADF